MRTALLLSAILFCSLSAVAQTGNVGIGTTSPSDQLHTTGTVRHEGYRGPGTRLVQIDSSGRIIVTGAGPVLSTVSNATISNNGCSTGTGVTSTISVSGQPTAVASSKISVRVNITHPVANELRVLLVAPNGNGLLLMGGATSGGANLYNTIFTDATQATLGGTAPTPPYTGKFRPVGSSTSLCSVPATMSSFAAIGGGSIVPNGTWTLKVFDGLSGANVGTLDNWSISFSGPESFTTAEQANYIPRFSAGGDISPSTLYQNSGSIGLGTTAPASRLHIADQDDDLLTLETEQPLSATQGTYLNFLTGGYYTGRIGTDGTGSTAASLGFYTGTFANTSGLQKRMTILNGGNVGIGLSDAVVSERLHVDGGNIKLGTVAWSSTANDRLLKFGDGNYVSIGEAGADDRLQLTGNVMHLKGYATNTQVGINTSTPGYTLDVTGDLRTTTGATIQGPMQVGGVFTAAGNATVGGSFRYSGGSPAAGKVLVASNTNGDAVWSGPVSFRAYQSVTYNSNGSYGFPLTNYTEEHDFGNGFNPTTGEFTAPVAGLYHFDVVVLVYNPSTTGGAIVDVKLLNSGTARDITIGSDLKLANQLDATRISETMYLAAGDVIHVHTAANFGHPYQVVAYTYDNEFSSFSGFLVR